VVATVIASVLTLAVILFLFWRPRSLLLLGFSILVPVLVTFGIAELTVDSLNTSTAFLISIMVGNGVNPGIVWLARYFEERRKGSDVEQSIALTHRGAWAGTLAAALGAALSYGSLMVADFKGFKDFGIISSVGMVVCWVLIMLLLPAITAASERILPMKLVAGKDRGTLYGRSIMAVVRRAPGTILIVLGLVVTVSFVLVARAVAADPLEYNFRNLRSVREGSTRASHLTGRVTDIVGGAAAGNAIAMLLPSREEVPGVVAQLQRMERRGLMGVVRTIDDLLPKDQEAKVPLAREIRELMLEARERAAPAQVARIDEYLPPEEIRALVPDDLPEEVARLYAERDGTRGRILFVSQPPNTSIWNGRDLVTWANRLRSVRLSDGTSPPLAGRAPVFADMIDVVVEDGPKAVAASFAATLLIVLFSFRRWGPRLLTIASLMVGVTWMSGAMALLGMKLNFLNFVAFPITFGNGVDYAVNVMRRYVQERADTGATPEAAVSASVMETGGAVIACSLTTVFGYLSILTSANLALESFGMAMSISELTCLTAAVTGIPSLLLWWSRRKRASGS
jgi:predicted RND superfamily exporter protein